MLDRGCYPYTPDVTVCPQSVQYSRTRNTGLPTNHISAFLPTKVPTNDEERSLFLLNRSIVWAIAMLATPFCFPIYLSYSFDVSDDCILIIFYLYYVCV